MDMWSDGRCQICFWMVWLDYAASHWCSGFNQASSTHRSMEFCPSSLGLHLSCSHCPKFGRGTLSKLLLCLNNVSNVICVGTVQRTCICSKTKWNCSWNDFQLIEKCCKYLHCEFARIWWWPEMKTRDIHERNTESVVQAKHNHGSSSLAIYSIKGNTEFLVMVCKHAKKKRKTLLREDWEVAPLQARLELSPNTASTAPASVWNSSQRKWAPFGSTYPSSWTCAENEITSPR